MKTGHGRDLYISEALDSDGDVEIECTQVVAYIDKAHAIEIIKHLAFVHGIRSEEEVDHKAALAEKEAELEKARELLRRGRIAAQFMANEKLDRDIKAYLGDKA
jgi:hypothetical protein